MKQTGYRNWIWLLAAMVIFAGYSAGISSAGLAVCNAEAQCCSPVTGCPAEGSLGELPPCCKIQPAAPGSDAALQPNPVSVSWDSTAVVWIDGPADAGKSLPIAANASDAAPRWNPFELPCGRAPPSSLH